MEPGDLTGALLDGRYRVIEPIAEGAMGVVYRAERVKLGRIVAIKVLHDELPAELASRKRFEIEAMAMAKLEHPHCAAVLDIGIHEQKPFVVMDFVSGPNLKDVIDEGPLPLSRAVEIIRQVLSGLAHAHELGIIHRDIKPANIILSQKAGLGDHVKILDFGLARLTADSGASGITTGIVVGTPSYMAPEQIRGVAIDQRTDLYACGILLFELLTGVKPFVSEKDDPIEVCSMHLKKKPPSLKDTQPGIDLEIVEAIVAKALAKKPDERYANAVEFATALDIVPTRRMQTAPVAIVSPPIAASETGWSVPAEAKSSMFPSDGAPSSEPVSGRSVPIAGAVLSEPEPEPATVLQSAPTAQETPPSAPHAVPTRPPSTPLREPPAGLPAPTPAARASAPIAQPRVPSAPIAQVPSAPIAQAPSAPVESPPSGPTQTPVGGLPADFDLSRAIPPLSPTAVNEKGLSPGFDLSLAIPQPAAATPILERSAPVPAQPAVPSDQPTMAMPDVKSTIAFLGAPPAGPSPLAVPDAPAVAEPVSLPPPPATPQLPLTAKQLRIVGASVLGLVLLIAIIAAASGGGSKKPTAIAADAADAPVTPDRDPSPPPASPADEQVTRAKQLLETGRQNEALELLLAARRVFPKDARFAYFAGKIYFERQWWSLGLKQFREVLALDATYRSDPEMIKIVLKAFITPAEYRDAADLGAFLRTDIGPPAKHYLEETARTHPRAGVRQRAKAEAAKIP